MLDTPTKDMKPAPGWRFPRFFRFGDDGKATLFRSPHRYVWPGELDLMAQLAGLALESRHADWSGSPFTATSQSHVSVYRKPV